MQTFLPYPSFIQSVQVLDMRRLGKQRVEAQQILNTLSGKSLGWKNHPAVKMWAGYENALSNYLAFAINEWTARGYVNNMARPKFHSQLTMPRWWGGAIHASHRSNLLRKNPEWYGRLGWVEANNMEYVWPT